MRWRGAHLLHKGTSWADSPIHRVAAVQVLQLLCCAQRLQLFDQFAPGRSTHDALPAVPGESALTCRPGTSRTRGTESRLCRRGRRLSLLCCMPMRRCMTTLSCRTSSSPQAGRWGLIRRTCSLRDLLRLLDVQCMMSTCCLRACASLDVGHCSCCADQPCARLSRAQASQRSAS